MGLALFDLFLGIVLTILGISFLKDSSNSKWLGYLDLIVAGSDYALFIVKIVEYI